MFLDILAYAGIVIGVILLIASFGSTFGSNKSLSDEFKAGIILLLMAGFTASFLFFLGWCIYRVFAT